MDFNNIERSINGVERMSDILYKWEKFAQSTNSGERVRFFIKKRLFLDGARPASTALEEQLIKAQVKHFRQSNHKIKHVFQDTGGDTPRFVSNDG